jgi:hypothetical protein
VDQNAAIAVTLAANDVCRGAWLIAHVQPVVSAHVYDAVLFTGNNRLRLRKSDQDSHDDG